MELQLELRPLRAENQQLHEKVSQLQRERGILYASAYRAEEDIQRVKTELSKQVTCLTCLLNSVFTRCMCHLFVQLSFHTLYVLRSVSRMRQRSDRRT